MKRALLLAVALALAVPAHAQDAAPTCADSAAVLVEIKKELVRIAAEQKNASEYKAQVLDAEKDVLLQFHNVVSQWRALHACET